MLLLLFYLGDEMYCIKCENVREVAPMVSLNEMSKAPECVPGLLNYRGTFVPVVDLKHLIQGTPCDQRLSTRIILVNFGKKEGAPYTIGLMAERVTETIRKSVEDFLPSGVALEATPYLSHVIMDHGSMIQFIDLELLPGNFKFLSDVGV